jgi:hypothetical protein
VDEILETQLVREGIERMKSLTEYAKPKKNQYPYGKGPKKVRELSLAEKILEARR